MPFPNYNEHVCNFLYKIRSTTETADAHRLWDTDLNKFTHTHTHTLTVLHFYVKGLEQ
jgi:hypothetical protein